MKLTHIRDVLAVAECGSMRAAARSLGVAQPALTRSIQEIERELGAALFERHARGVQTTEAGHAFLRRAQSVQSELRRAKEEIEQIQGGVAGQVAMAVSTASTIAMMPAALAAFRRRYPQAVLKVTESLFAGIETQLAEGNIDFYVGPFDASLSSSSFHCEKLFAYRRLILARTDHPLAQATCLPDLRDAHWVRPLTLLPNRSEIDFDELFERETGSAPNIVMYAHSALMTLLTVANSDLLTILPQQWLEVPLTSERLVSIDATRDVPILSMCIVRRHAMPLTPMAESLCDEMRRAGTHYAHRIERV
ncbi:MAG: LysR family transcriptional regulator [Sphingomonas sp.]|nr:LysR family transcriptional regulator [Sphingomonas sp.]